MLSKKSMQFLRQLIALRTVTGDQKQQKKAIDLIDKNITPVLKSKTFYKKGYCTKLFYSQKPTNFDALFVVHIDVVDGSQQLFSLKKKGNRLYGRGVFDMKGPAVAVINALNGFFGEKRKKSIGLLVTCDEETGGYNGVKMFLEKNHITADVVVVPDGGDDIHRVVVEEKGVLNIEISYKGVSAHASRPWDGVNAAAQLMGVIQKITRRFPSGNGSMWKTVAALISIQTDTVANNTIPHFASARFMFRYVQKDSVEKIMTFIQSLDHSLRIDILSQGDALKISSKNRFIKMYCDSVKRKTKKLCMPVKYHSACDARYFAARGMPVIISRPCGGGAHGETEWISEEQLNIFSDILLDFLCAVENVCE